MPCAQAPTKVSKITWTGQDVLTSPLDTMDLNCPTYDRLHKLAKDKSKSLTRVNEFDRSTRYPLESLAPKDHRQPLLVGNTRFISPLLSYSADVIEGEEGRKGKGARTGLVERLFRGRPAPNVDSHGGGLHPMFARWQNLIPSFPSIVPRWREAGEESKG